MKKILFRVDSSTQIGSGHLMRCLTLANQLRDRSKILFVCRDLECNLSSLVKENSFDLILLPREDEDEKLIAYEKWLTVKPKIDAEQTKVLVTDLDVDYLIIDSYAIDEEWENIIRPYVGKIMVIDDLANRKHNCDILLDQNYYSDMDTRYHGLVHDNCQLLLGPQYVLLREEFYEARKKMRIRDGIIKNILVFFGGSDLTNETMKVLEVLKELNRQDIIVNVVAGSSNKNKNAIEWFCNQNKNMNYLCQVNNMAAFMNQADLGIGAGGSTTWERCFLGLPTIVIAIAQNQIKISEDCDEYGIIKYIGTQDNVNGVMLKNSIVKLCTDSEYVKNIVKKSCGLFGRLDKARVANQLFE